MLQPIKKSFTEYIKKGYSHGGGTSFDDEQALYLLSHIAYIDDSILIIDDIIDKSETRNGKQCLYKEVGLQNAIIHAELLKTQAIEALIELMDILKVSPSNKIKVHTLMNTFWRSIYTGENLDSELASAKKVHEDMIKQYMTMIALFTGGHIQYGLSIGQLLANKKPDIFMDDIAISLGIVRQICDDFDDYFPSHHEPFGDFIRESHRLPEILFLIYGGKRQKVLDALQESDYKQAREIVLGVKVRNALYKFCNDEIEKIKVIKTDFDYSDMIEDYEKILEQVD